MSETASQPASPAPPPNSPRWAAIGPGLLFAAAAVGVSHLVQSTRAGAVYGLAMIGLVLLANLLKYPAFRFGTHYAAATGTSLLEGYRRQGRWALHLYAVVTVGTMFAVQAAVTVVTAGILKTLCTGEDLPGVVQALGAASPVALSGLLLGVSAVLLAWGQYRWLDRVTRVLVAVLTLGTLAATALVLGRVPWSTLSLWPAASAWTPQTVAFVIALVGWMPSAIDVAVWQSLWTLERARDAKRAVQMRASTLDFHIGYVGTTLLAVCFVLLGAGVLYSSGETLQPQPGAFAAQIIGLYRSTLGDWSGPLIGMAALAVMFSTTLTVLDGFPRALAVLVARYRSMEQPWTGPEPTGANRADVARAPWYWAAIAVQTAGALALLQWWLSSLSSFVDVATTLSFLTAPVLAALNHRAVTGPEVPPEHRPARWLLVLNGVGIAVMLGLALVYLWMRLR